MRALAVAVLAVLGLAIAACENQPSAPQGGPGHQLEPASGIPLASANASCRYTINPPGNGPPVSSISVPVGGTATLIPTNIADCDGAWGFITQSAVRVEFNNSGAPCTDFAQEEGGGLHLFKIYRCVSGPALLRIYTNASATTLLQSIQIDPIP